MPSCDVELPIVLYGPLKPGEPGHHIIERHVQPGEIVDIHGFSLYVDDGLPFGRRNDDGLLPGARLARLTTSGYEAVRSYASTDLYRWERCSLDDGAVDANILVRKGSVSEHAEQSLGAWSAASDPLLSSGMFTVHELIQQTLDALPGALRAAPTQAHRFWAAMFRLDAASLLLWSVLERYSTFRHGTVGGPEGRMTLLFNDEQFKNHVVHAGVPEGFRIKDSRGTSSPAATSADGTNGGKNLRLARSNMTHRGKAAATEARLVANALLWTYRIAGDLFRTTVCGIEQSWTEIDAAGLPQIDDDEIERLFV